MSQPSTSSSNTHMSWLEKSLLGQPISRLPVIVPGLLAAAALALAATGLARFIGVELMGFEKSPISAVMMAILLGLAIGNVGTLPSTLKPGVTFAVTKLLRLGIILLGIRLSLLDVFKLGAVGVPIVLICILAAIIITSWFNKSLKLPVRLGTLIAVGTSICGVSAIVGIAPAINAEDEEVAYAVAVITIFGILATFAYPWLAHAIFAGDAVKAGLFMGTSIHDTSQVTGAALMYADFFSAPRGLDVATVTKLVRNTFMMAVIPGLSFRNAWLMRQQDKDFEAERVSVMRFFPLFLLGFLALAVVRSVGDATLVGSGSAYDLFDPDAWGATVSGIQRAAVWLLTIALAGVGLGTNFRSFAGLGLKPFLVGLTAAACVGLVSIVTISTLGSFLTF